MTTSLSHTLLSQNAHDLFGVFQCVQIESDCVSTIALLPATLAAVATVAAFLPSLSARCFPAQQESS